MSSTTEVLQQARRLRHEGQLEASHTLVAEAVAAKRLSPVQEWVHRPHLWGDLATNTCVLTRRRSTDAAFIMSLWEDKDFVHNFHRMAPPLPREIGVLQKILHNEYLSLLTDTKALHWIIRDGKQQPWGVLSLTDISLQHQRAELLLGLKKGAPFGLSLVSSLMLFRFFFGVLEFHKLYALVFDDNPKIHSPALSVGFRKEGVLREHVRDPGTGTFLDLQQISILAPEAFSARNERLWKRLVKQGNPGN